MAKKKVRAAVVGLGMGRGHARGYKEGGADLFALCDVNEERLAAVKAELDVPHAFTDFDTMLECDEIDVVSVALPNHLHAPFTIKALRAGKHVLCEKPMAMNAKEAKRMIDARDKSGKKLMIHFNNRLRPQSQLLKQWVDAGELGEVYYARTVWNRTRGVPGLGTWFTQKKLAGGGPLIDLGVHRLDLALWLMGYPEVKTVTGCEYHHLAKAIAKKQRKKMDVEDLATAYVRLANGASLSLEASWATNSEKREDMYTQLWGTKGGCADRNVGEGYEFECRLWKDGPAGMVEVIPKQLPPGRSCQAHFVECILKDKEPMATAEQGLTVMKILDAI